ncbi:protein of unknown function [Methylocaldum szegediense]|uniref:Uncharacterized protein n=1 Tax=Methylocaldum szegediense TaxID=73780 RepID=A0ABM9HWX3_9GAMM|nr:protein of unknown function [Methylocaldum szegediense]
MQIADAALEVETQIRQQIDLVDQDQIGAMEHVRVFQRFVLALGDREHDHADRFAQIEHGRTDQIADVLDEQNAVIAGFQILHTMADHVRVQVAALAGIDLQHRNAGGAYALRIVLGLLVAFDHADVEPLLEFRDAALQQRGLAGTGARKQVNGQNAVAFEKLPVASGMGVVAAEDVLFDANDALLAEAVDTQSGRTAAVMMMTMVMVVIVGVHMPGIVDVRVMVLIGFAATANGTHAYSTSKSRTLNSSPPVTFRRCPLQPGQGS